MTEWPVTDEYAVKIHRHVDSETVEVQVEDKTVGCHAGNVGCAFARAITWHETGKTIEHEGCIVGEPEPKHFHDDFGDDE